MAKSTEQQFCFLILPSPESFLVCNYKSDQKKPHTAAFSLWELMNIETRGKFIKLLQHIILKFRTGILNFFLNVQEQIQGKRERLDRHG